MATMGRREVRRNLTPSQESPMGLRAPAVNLISGTTIVQPVSTLEIRPSVGGSPIMREDFITTTGVMPPKLD
jgi:hypothetical protein